MSVEIGLNEVERLCAQRSPAFISTGKDLTPATENLRFRETKTLPEAELINTTIFPRWGIDVVRHVRASTLF